MNTIHKNKRQSIKGFRHWGFLSLIILSCLCYTVNVEAQKLEKVSIVGTWNVDFNRMKQNKGPKALEYDRLAKSERKNKMNRSFEERLYTFREDGTYVIAVLDGKKAEGIWEYSLEGNSVILTSTSGKQMSYAILYANSQKVGLSAVSASRGQMLYPDIHLRKVKK